MNISSLDIDLLRLALPPMIVNHEVSLMLRYEIHCEGELLDVCDVVLVDRIDCSIYL